MTIDEREREREKEKERDSKARHHFDWLVNIPRFRFHFISPSTQITNRFHSVSDSSDSMECSNKLVLQ